MKRLIVSEYMIPGEPFEIRIARTPWIDPFWYIYRKWTDTNKYFRVDGVSVSEKSYWYKNYPTQFKTPQAARKAWEESKKK